MHLATDAQEPALAGNWRGSFGHKNMAAAAVMAMVLFIGIYMARSGAWLSGVAIVALAALFMLYRRQEFVRPELRACWCLTSLMTVIRPFWLRAVMLLAPLVLLNLLGVGSVISDQLAEIAKLLPVDTSFTGRTDIWTFAIAGARRQRLCDRLWLRRVLGRRLRQEPAAKAWSGQRHAAHSHNGYLDTRRLTMGLPGLALVIAVLVIAPLRNFQTAETRRQRRPAGDDVAAHLAVRDLSVVAGELLPRPR